MKITHNGKRFEAEATYFERNKLKGCGWSWSKADKKWVTTSEEKALKLQRYFDEVARAVTAVKVEEEAKKLEGFSKVASAIEVPCPEGLEFLPHQLAGIEYALGRGGCLVADEPGLGKTIISVGLVNKDESLCRVLVICPASLKLNWVKEIKKWGTRPGEIHLERVDGRETQEVLGVGKRVVWHVINFEALQRVDVKSREWDLLIVDEAHSLKNPKAQRTLEVLGGRSKAGERFLEIPAGKRLFLTGTPVLNKPVELWTILRALDPTRWKSSGWLDFVKRYCAGSRVNGFWDVSGASNMVELAEILSKTVMIRRLKKEVLDLPEKLKKTVILEAGEEEKEVLGVEKEAYEARSAGGVFEDVAWSTLRKGVGMMKVGKVVARAMEVLGEEECVVIFAHHRAVVDGIREALKKKKVESVALVGGMTVEAKQEAIDAFQEGRVRVFVGSLLAAGVGITLTRASRMLIAEIDPRPGMMDQVEDRIYRIGTTKGVTIEYLVYEGSVDARLVDLVENKRRMIKGLMG